jgi:hypothetical protein
MNGKTILNYLTNDLFSKHIPKYFLYPDTTISISQKPALVIINTDLSSGPGEHWCVAFLNNNICDYFDPLGFPPQHDQYDFVPKLLPFCDFIIHNKVAVQTETSSVCGHHCLYFLFLKSRGYSLCEIITNFFSSNNNKNDEAVQKFILNLK